MKKINVFCVLVLALMLIDLVVDLFINTSDALCVCLLSLGAVVAAMVYFVKFVMNVNRNEVFSEKNIKLIRKYGYCALLCGVCTMILTSFVSDGFWNAVVDGLDAFGEGFFALLMGEVFGIGLKLKETQKRA